jgi:hypothetical protein
MVGRFRRKMKAEHQAHAQKPFYKVEYNYKNSLLTLYAFFL